MEERSLPRMMNPTKGEGIANLTKAEEEGEKHSELLVAFSFVVFLKSIRYPACTGKAMLSQLIVYKKH